MADITLGAPVTFVDVPVQQTTVQTLTISRIVDLPIAKRLYVQFAELPFKHFLVIQAANYDAIGDARRSTVVAQIIANAAVIITRQPLVAPDL